MFLTGFDAPTLNTLYVDKNLRYHGLIQAFSRTNRILNSVKQYGNIVCFRDLQKNTEDALALFGNKDAEGIALLKPYEHYLKQYKAKVAELLSFHGIGDAVPGSETEQKHFVQVFGEILKLRNMLAGFDEFTEDDDLSPRDMQDLQSVYLEIREELGGGDDGSADGSESYEQQELEFEIELLRQVDVNVDYILMLVEQYRSKRGDGDDKEIRAEISRAVNASPTLRSKRDLIEDFVDGVSPTGQIDQEWLQFIASKRESELETIITDERLRPDETRVFVATAFRDGHVQTGGTAITKVLPPVSRFSAQGQHGATKQRVIEKLTAFFERFSGLGASS